MYQFDSRVRYSETDEEGRLSLTGSGFGCQVSDGTWQGLVAYVLADRYRPLSCPGREDRHQHMAL